MAVSYNRRCASMKAFILSAFWLIPGYLVFFEYENRRTECESMIEITSDPVRLAKIYHWLDQELGQDRVEAVNWDRASSHVLVGSKGAVWRINAPDLSNLEYEDFSSTLHVVPSQVETDVYYFTLSKNTVLMVLHPTTDASVMSTLLDSKQGTEYEINNKTLLQCSYMGYIHSRQAELQESVSGND